MGTWGWMGSLVGLLPPLLLLLLVAPQFAHAQDKQSVQSKRTLFGDKCNETKECDFPNAVCQKIKGCQCVDEFPVTNHLDKCGKVVKVNESCIFSEQCEAETEKTECRDHVCVCMFEMQASTKPDGTHECVAVKNETHPEKYIDPAMIGILVAMFLMFITICVVLRLFSKARWRENRTIFNTPNPRLMNVSLLRDSKLLHERRGSRGSVRGPSRQPSMASLRPHSPNSPGSRRGSHGSSNASGTTSNKSPPPGRHHAHADAHGRDSSVTTPMLESVTVEIQK
ncbi:uncharacterized protein jus isoform X2 [Atheta coriaria]|uniref:uncharacterized protein jus isoform X2 n=1 Tax=Dalotia coriaria TaxID=877792 RepID=UPI0031F43BD8